MLAYNLNKVKELWFPVPRDGPFRARNALTLAAGVYPREGEDPRWLRETLGTGNLRLQEAE